MGFVDGEPAGLLGTGCRGREGASATSRLWLEQVKEMGLPSADPGQGSCAAPATEEAPDSGEDCVTAHTRVTRQGCQWKPEGRGERQRGGGGCPKWSRRVRRQARLQSGNFYRADGRRESGPNQRVIKPRISASSKAGPRGTGASWRWGKLPLTAVRGWGPPTREALREWPPRQPPSSPPAVRCQSALQGSGGGGREGGRRLEPFGLCSGILWLRGKSSGRQQSAG